MAVTREDLTDLIGKLRDRAHILHMVADCLGAASDKPVGSALGVLAEDIRADLDVLADGLENFGGVA